MIHKIEDIPYLEQKYNIPFEEIVFMDLNLSGVSINMPYKRVRFSLKFRNVDLFFSTENNHYSHYKVDNSKLFFDDKFLFEINFVVEDTCNVFYTRNKEKVLCFNPNNRSLCNGCKFCYHPTTEDKKTINGSILKQTFIDWINENKYIDLSHLEQVAIVTGCFQNEDTVVDYLIKLREILTELGFTKEILYFGNFTNINSIKSLSKIKPLQLVFTLECFENREIILTRTKNLPLEQIKNLMNLSIQLGIKTTFSYVLGLDTMNGLMANIQKTKNYINSFPIISLFQTDNNREKYRNQEAYDIEYYHESRKYIEATFKDTSLYPNSWNNYRSLWRTCYNGKNIIDDIL